MKKNPKKAAKITLILAIICIILIFISGSIRKAVAVEKYGFIINAGKNSILETILYFTAMILFICSYIINHGMSRCPKCNKYISGNINMEYCPYCSEKFPDIEE